jgi:glycosyltransferase involved in cell wall biosynthesis
MQDSLWSEDDPEKYSLLKRSRVCLFPSRVEEWGIVPQEALASGLPVVVYDLTVYEENIKPCEAVFCLPIGDIEGMAHRVIELLAGSELKQYELVGPDFVRRFGWDEVAEREFQVLTGSRAVHGVHTETGARDSRCEVTEAREGSSPPSRTTFSVVIPALNEAENIGDLIDDIQQQVLPPALSLDKIVVVSDCSTDGTEAIVASAAARDDKIELLVNATRLGNAQAINIGKSRVDSDYLVILDGDIRLEGKDSIRNLLSDIQPGVGMVGGNPRPVRDSAAFAAGVNECGAFIRDELRSRIRGGSNLISALGCILALDRNLYSDVEIPLNPDSPELLVPNDQFFYMKCLEKGMRFETREDARVRYKLSSSIKDTNRQGMRFVFSMSSMDSFFDESLLKREYHFPLPAIIRALWSAFRRKPALTVAWGTLHLYVQVKVFVWRHVLKKGVNAAWEVSKTSKSGIDWNIPS